MPESLTVAEHAVEFASDLRWRDKVFVTGRVLVKKAFEHMDVPEEEDTASLMQYLGPQLRLLGRALFHFSSKGLPEGDREALMLKRIIQMNNDVKSVPDEYSLYDKHGKIH